MIPSNPIPPVCNYGSSATYCTCPSDEQVANGVIPLDSLPAAWWNWLWSKSNIAINCARSAAGELITEINNVLQAAGVCPNSVCTDQLYQSIEKIRQTIGNDMVPGAVKSSSCPGDVCINSQGYMSVNCLGNAANLTTTARTVVGAINELKCTYDCCIGDINTAICDLQNCKAPLNHASCDTTYGVGSATEYGHLKISDTFTSCVGGAAEGVAASQKALYDAYTCLSNMPVTFAECACCAYITEDQSNCANTYPIFAFNSDNCGHGCNNYKKMYYHHGAVYNRCQQVLCVCGMQTNYLIQKKGMLNLDILPACVEICNKWKVCAFSCTCTLWDSDTSQYVDYHLTVFCNYGTDFTIINYGTLSAGLSTYGIDTICRGFLTPLFPLNLVLAPNENAVIPIDPTAFVGRPAAVITF